MSLFYTSMASFFLLINKAPLFCHSPIGGTYHLLLHSA